VTTSQQNAKQLQERSAQASAEAAHASPGSSTKAPKSSPAPAAAGTSTAAGSRVTGGTAAHSAPAPSKAQQRATTGAGKAATPAMQAKVESELKQGKVVTILFWNPKGTDDAAVHGQLQSVAGKLRGSIAVHAALASQVASFGTIIRGVKVYGTPTVMIINKQKQALTLTGYTDAYAIEQAISEARHA
jgi:hypothetical protein